jgi:D-glycero-alpha-D-manno-heptose-7-phosphate kinase
MAAQCRAPVRIDLGGGPTDVNPFASSEGGTVLSFAIARYATATVERLAASNARPGSTGYERHGQGAWDLRLASYVLQAQDSWAEYACSVSCDVPVGCGLGTSGAISVATLGALLHARGEQCAPLAVAEEARRIESTFHGIHEGGQDQYCAALGGLNLMTFGSDGINVRQLPVTISQIGAMQMRLLLCYTGSTRDSGSLTAAVMRRYAAGERRVAAALRRLRELASILADILLADDFDSLGPGLDEVWRCQRSLDPGVSPPNITQLIELGLRRGATGAKIVGAGGGGCILYCVASEEQMAPLRDAIARTGHVVLPVVLETGGLTCN